MREWLTVIIVLLIVGVLLDGFRRMRAHRKETVRLSSNMPDVDPLLEEGAASGSEFPSGGARVVGYREETDAENLHQSVKDRHAASKLTCGAPNRTPEQAALNLDSPVPMLMESVQQPELTAAADSHLAAQDHDFADGHEPAIGNLDELDEAVATSSSGERVQEHSTQEGDSNAASAQNYRVGSDEVSAPRVVKRESSANPIHSPRNIERPQANDSEPPQAPDEVLVINVMAKRGQILMGGPLLQAFLENGLRFGDMDIFHRHENSDGTGPTIFSAANMVKPGMFDISAMEAFETPGISLFLTLPIHSDSLDAYDLMAKVARNMADKLGGELKDENRSVMTRQTIEHGRHRVMEYERKRRLAKA